MANEEGLLELVARQLCDEKRWEFIECAGGGAFKRVFKAATQDGKFLAVKILKAKSARTEREVSALKRCSHTAIAVLVDQGALTSNGREYDYQIEHFFEGGSLDQRINVSSLDKDSAFNIGSILLSALQHLNELGLVHRDVKPANIMFRDKGVIPVLVDFGLVRDLGRSSLTQSWAAQGPGTPFFAPPEQLNNDKEIISWCSDQFSVGVSLLYACTGLHPYQYPHETQAGPETIDRVLSRSACRPDLADICSQIGLPCIRKMVQPWPIDRYRKPQQLIALWEQQR